jgi:hypothetical protein
VGRSRHSAAAKTGCTDRHITALMLRGVTPLITPWYWGDRTCLDIRSLSPPARDSLASCAIQLYGSGLGSISDAQHHLDRAIDD